MDLTTFYERHERRRTARAVIGVLYFIAAAFYLSWRVTVVNFDYPIFSTVFFIAEMSSLALAAGTFFLQWKVKRREPAEAPRGLSVDVFVPTYNERRELVRRTVLAAMHIDYPHETWLLDDGNRQEMKDLAAELGCHYLAREINTGAKPGNLNNALKYAEAEFIAVIDCDHIAQRDYLDRLLGYFDDPNVAFVQAPQDYYNVNAFQFRNDSEKGLLWHDQSSFFSVMQVGRDYWDAATCCGTSTIVRRSVVDEIGGFPEATVTEDMQLAVKAQKLGYKSIYYPLPLAYGVAPVDLGEYQKQRLRWGQGNVQTCREEGLPFTKGLTLPQRISYSYLGSLYFEGWVRLVFYLTPPIVLLFGIAPIEKSNQFLPHFIPFAIFTWLYFEEMGRGHMRLFVNEQMAMARFPVFILATFAVFRQRIKWNVSSKEFVGHFQPYLLLPQMAVLVVSLIAILWTLAGWNETLFQEFTPGIIGFGVFWAGFHALLATLVIRASIRGAANKRPDYRFAVPLPLDVRFDGGPAMRGRVVNISATGMTFETEGAMSGRSTSIAGHIHVPGFRVPFEAHPDDAGAFETKGGKTLVTCVFEWRDLGLRDRLDLSLHSCAWHRKLAWGGAFFLTPLEWVENLFVKQDLTERLVTNHWTMLYRVAGAPEDEAMLGIVVPSRTAAGTMVTLFEDLPAGTQIELVWCENPDETGRVVTLGAQPWAGEAASAGADDVKSYTYSGMARAEFAERWPAARAPVAAVAAGE